LDATANNVSPPVEKIVLASSTKVLLDLFPLDAIFLLPSVETRSEILNNPPSFLCEPCTKGRAKNIPPIPSISTPIAKNQDLDSPFSYDGFLTYSAFPLYEGRDFTSSIWFAKFLPPDALYHFALPSLSFPPFP